jgi:hypothetical protein
MIMHNEKALERIFKAQRSPHDYRQAADAPHDIDNDTVSMLTSTTAMRASTAFAFDSVIKDTAVYQRCMRRRSDRTGLLSLGLSAVPLTMSSRTKALTNKREQGSRSGVAFCEKATEESVKPRTRCEQQFREDMIEASARSEGIHVETPGNIQIDSLDSNLNSALRHSAEVSNPDHVSPKQLSVRPADTTSVTAHCGATNVPINNHDIGANTMRAAENCRSAPSADLISNDAIVGRPYAFNRSDKSVLDSWNTPTIKLSKLKAPHELAPRTSTKVLYDHQEAIINMAVSSKSILAVASADTIRLWDLSTGKEAVKSPYQLYSYTKSGLVFSSDGTLLAVVHFVPDGLDPSVSVWNPEAGIRLCTLVIDNMFGNIAIAIAISADNKLVACGQEDKIASGKSKTTVVL